MANKNLQVVVKVSKAVKEEAPDEVIELHPALGFPLPAQLVADMLDAAGTAAGTMDAHSVITLPAEMVATLKVLLSKHPEEEVRAFFLNELTVVS